MTLSRHGYSTDAHCAADCPDRHVTSNRSVASPPRSSNGRPVLLAAGGVLVTRTPFQKTAGPIWMFLIPRASFSLRGVRKLSTKILSFSPLRSNPGEKLVTRSNLKRTKEKGISMACANCSRVPVCLAVRPQLAYCIHHDSTIVASAFCSISELPRGGRTVSRGGGNRHDPPPQRGCA
jgi:hypothetical protein